MPFGAAFGAAGSSLEKDYDAPYKAWKLNPDKHHTTLLLGAVQPSIDKAIQAHVGPPNPLLRSRARKMALGAIRSYDPTKAKLGTHLMNQLQGLKRVARQQNTILSVPERVGLDQAHLANSINELQDDLGRTPSLGEIADHTGMSLRRIQHIRKFRQPIAEGSFQQGMGDDDGAYDPGVEQAPSNAWHELVYGDLDPTNQKIMEYTLGMYGRKQLSNQEIAGKLRMTPGAVSQRKAIIQKIIDQQSDLSPFG